MSSAPFEEGFFDLDSGYVSAAENPIKRTEPPVGFSKQHLQFLNAQLQKLGAEDILRWSIMTLPDLYQETALGLTGSVIMDMLSKLSGPIKPTIDTIFIDTLYHFDETLELLEQFKTRFAHATKFHVYKPAGANTTEEFEAQHGKNLWSRDSERYDFLVKVEPSERAYSELNVKAIITGRRKTQGGGRNSLDIVEVSDEGVVKINPLANWSFEQVSDYVHDNQVPYNALLDLGYKSIGDWHSTAPVAEGEDERSGRWKGTGKTECGIHNPASRYAQFLMEKEKEERQKALEEAFQRNTAISA